MHASRLFKKLREDYVSSQRDRIRTCNKFYAEYACAYHEFLLIRDLHVRLCGSTHHYTGSDFANEEISAYEKAMVCANKYVRFAIESYNIDLVVPCRQVDILAITKQRVRDELLSPIHPDLNNFICLSSFYFNNFVR